MEFMIRRIVGDKTDMANTNCSGESDTSKKAYLQTKRRAHLSPLHL